MSHSWPVVTGVGGLTHPRRDALSEQQIGARQFGLRAAVFGLRAAAFTLFAFTSGSAAGVLRKMNAICPASRSAMPGASPL